MKGSTHHICHTGTTAHELPQAEGLECVIEQIGGDQAFCVHSWFGICRNNAPNTCCCVQLIRAFAPGTSFECYGEDFKDLIQKRWFRVPLQWLRARTKDHPANVCFAPYVLVVRLQWRPSDGIVDEVSCLEIDMQSVFSHQQNK